jgi:hypothetical protein
LVFDILLRVTKCKYLYFLFFSKLV